MTPRTNFVVRRISASEVNEGWSPKPFFSITTAHGLTTFTSDISWVASIIADGGVYVDEEGVAQDGEEMIAGVKQSHSNHSDRGITGTSSDPQDQKPRSSSPERTPGAMASTEAPPEVIPRGPEPEVESDDEPGEICIDDIEEFQPLNYTTLRRWPGR